MLNILDKLLFASTKRRIYKTVKKNIQDQLDEKLMVQMITNTKEVKLKEKENK